MCCGYYGDVVKVLGSGPTYVYGAMYDLFCWRSRKDLLGTGTGKGKGS